MLAPNPWNPPRRERYPSERLPSRRVVYMFAIAIWSAFGFLVGNLYGTARRADVAPVPNVQHSERAAVNALCARGWRLQDRNGRSACR